MKILIIEDEIELSDFLRDSFVDEGFSVDVANDGMAGFELALENEYDVIILDNVLPKKEGKQVCRDLRAAGKHLPIIMLSVKSEIETKVDMLNIGMDDYLTKPFSFEELMARIRAVLRRPKKIEGEILQVGDLTLDLMSQKVKCRDKEVHLTCKEFSILACLMKNKGNVISRNEIMAYAWDENFDHFSNSLESHIVNIRKKIKNCCKKSNIETIVNRGYRIGNEE